jgi:WD40 repeat protein
MADEQKDSTSENAQPNLQPSERRWMNPVKIYRAYLKRKKLEKEKALLLREERMNEDLERYLMEIEEHRCWVVFQLKHLNYERMKKKEQLNKIIRKEKDARQKDEEEWDKETGLSYFLGSVQSYKRWQNSPAKYLDYTGHQGAVTACKLSFCLNYMISCSEDKTIKLWNIESGECLKTLAGHVKIVNDAALHKEFKMFRRNASIISGSSDGTLKIWNSSDTNPLLTLYGHKNAVHRVDFAPDGKSIISCSEDHTIRTWCFPEGYNLYVYKGHTSGVLSVRFSGSGRYFASGSDYGERKILLWDAKMPHFREPQQFPHIFFWTPEGLIKKILIRKTIPKPNFWLMQTQLNYIKDDDDMEIWSGEVSDIEEDENGDDSDTESEHEDTLDELSVTSGKRKDAYAILIADDVRELKGITLRVIHIGSEGEQSEATEYNPGGFLIVSIQSTEQPISDAFLDAMAKSTRYDAFSLNAGQRLGRFDLNAPIPWLSMKKSVDAKGRITYSRESIQGVIQSKDEQCVIFHDRLVQRPFHNAGIASKQLGEGENNIVEEYDPFKKLDIVWTCPKNESMGAIVIVLNCKLKGSGEWLQLRYSVKESAIRYMKSSDL